MEESKLEKMETKLCKALQWTMWAMFGSCVVQLVVDLLIVVVAPLDWHSWLKLGAAVFPILILHQLMREERHSKWLSDQLKEARSDYLWFGEHLAKEMSTTPEVALFTAAVMHEVARARAKFPSSECSMTALTEEVGELAKALLDESDARVRAEAIQVACMACRVATEGDPTLTDYRVRRGLREDQVLQ